MAKKARNSAPAQDGASTIEAVEPKSVDMLEYALLRFNMNPQLATAIASLNVELLNAETNEMPRLLAYSDYDDMEYSIPEVKTALDIFADVACMGTEGNIRAFEILTEDIEVKRIAEELIERVDLYNKIWSIARDVRKYGDDFEEIVVEGNKITRLKNLSVYTMYREEDGQGNLKGFTQRDFNGKKLASLQPENVIHLRNDRPRNVVPHEDMKHKYGTSLLYPLRRLYSMLLLMEEGMVFGRLYRSHMRYKIVVDVTGMDSETAKKTIQMYRSMFKKKKLTDPLTGRLNPKMAGIMAPTDDFFIGARKDGVTPDVSTVSEQGNLGNIADVQYFQNKLFAVLKLPKSFMAYEADVNAKATLAKEDVSFGRTVRRLQSFLASFVKQVIDKELLLNGINPKKSKYEIKFAEVSMEDEGKKFEVFKMKADTGLALLQAGIIDKPYLAIKMLGIPEDEFKKMKPEPPPAAPPNTPAPKPEPKGKKEPKQEK